MEESGEQTFNDDSNAERSGIVIDTQPVDKDKVYGSTSVRLHTSSKISGSVYGGNHYHHQLFECGQYDTCFLSFFCYCIASSFVARRLDIYPCYPRCFGVLPMAVRFRTLNGIDEDFCLEGCEAHFCPCCFTNRLLQEMDLRNFDLHASNDTEGIYHIISRESPGNKVDRD